MKNYLSEEKSLASTPEPTWAFLKYLFPSVFLNPKKDLTWLDICMKKAQ